MTQTVAKECSWPRGKVSNKVSGDLSLTLMEKKMKYSRGYSSGFVHDYNHPIEAVGESEGFVSPRHVSEDSCAPKRRCISLNSDRCDGFFVPMQVITLSKMSSLERKDLEKRLQQELELVQKFQKKILSSTAFMSNGAVVSSSCDPLDKKHNLTSQIKHCGGGGKYESIKQVPASKSFNELMKQCEALLKRLLGHQYAWVFNKPVDVVKLNIPDYFTVIKQPMDLGTIQSNISSGSYTSPVEFAVDVRLTFSNAMTYNPPGNDVHVMADAMSKFFEMRWKPIAKKLGAVDAALKREAGAAEPVAPSKKIVSQEDCNTIVLDSKPKMTDEEKLTLSRRLSLISEFPQHIVDFLKRHIDNTNQNAEDEIEIDFDSLTGDTLFELKKLLDDYAKQNHSDWQVKTDPLENEILNESGLSNSSMHPYKGNEPVDDDEYVDIGGNDPPTTSCYPVEGVSNLAPRSSRGSSSISSSSTESGSSSSDSDSSSSSRRQSNIKALGSPNFLKGKGPQIATSSGKAPASGEQPEQGSHLNSELAKPTGNHEGENAPTERLVSPDKLYRAALLRSRFADTIIKAREKTLEQGEKKDPEILRREREELERQQREERARLQAEAKAAEEARKQAEEDAAAEAKRKREMEREAARQALLQMEKSVEINEGNIFLKDLEMLRTGPSKHAFGSANEVLMGDFKFGGCNPLEQLGLYIKADDEEEGDCDVPVSAPIVEDGEIS